MASSPFIDRGFPRARQELVDISREIGRQQTKNRYYRECYAALKLLQEITAETIAAVDELFESQTPEAMTPVHKKFFQLQETACQLAQRACRAEEACEELCALDVTCSARRLLEPITRMIKGRSSPAPGVN